MIQKILHNTTQTTQQDLQIKTDSQIYLESPDQPESSFDVIKRTKLWAMLKNLDNLVDPRVLAGQLYSYTDRIMFSSKLFCTKYELINCADNEK